MSPLPSMAAILAVGVVFLSTTVGTTAGAATRLQPNRVDAATENARVGTILVCGTI